MRTDSKVEGRQRIDWIDWMKTIGMYFIVVGHFFPKGDIVIYTFSVPMFFIISGGLTKREKELKAFYHKVWNSLVIPLLILTFLRILINICIQILDDSLNPVEILKYQFIYGVLGKQSVLGPLWFVYTLIVIKVIHQWCPQSLEFYVAALFSILAYYYNHSSPFHQLLIQNSFTDVFTAYPMFCIGVYIKTQIKTLYRKVESRKSIISVFCCMCIFLACSKLNGYVWMYRCGYGQDLLLFFIGALSGTFLIFFVSYYLRRSSHVITISKGTILILGFHSYFIDLFRNIIPSSTFLDYIFSALIIVLFIPLIKITERYFPMVLGKNRIR